MVSLGEEMVLSRVIANQGSEFLLAVTLAAKSDPPLAVCVLARRWCHEEETVHWHFSHEYLNILLNLFAGRKEFSLYFHWENCWCKKKLVILFPIFYLLCFLCFNFIIILFFEALDGLPYCCSPEANLQEISCVPGNTLYQLDSWTH